MDWLCLLKDLDVLGEDKGFDGGEKLMMVGMLVLRRGGNFMKLELESDECECFGWGYLVYVVNVIIVVYV